jgi:putative redox protein
VAAALGSCIATTMGIVANRHQINLKGLRIDITKEMVTVPARKIGTITVHIHMPQGIAQEHRKLLENTAHACPVHKSLHSDVQVPIQFYW